MYVPLGAAGAEILDVCMYLGLEDVPCMGFHVAGSAMYVCTSEAENTV